jgi:hypothetical protein
MHDHGQIYSGIEGASPGRFAALVTKHEVVTLGKLGEERAQALGRAPVAAMSGFRIAVVHDCPERVDLRRMRTDEWRALPPAQSDRVRPKTDAQHWATIFCQQEKLAKVAIF